MGYVCFSSVARLDQFDYGILNWQVVGVDDMHLKLSVVPNPGLVVH